jgi:hypothetical protein
MPAFHYATGIFAKINLQRCSNLHIDAAIFSCILHAARLAGKMQLSSAQRLSKGLSAELAKT